MEWFHKLLSHSKYNSYSMSPKYCEDHFIEPLIEICPPLLMGLLRGPSNTISPHFQSVFQITISHVYRIQNFSSDPTSPKPLLQVIGFINGPNLLFDPISSPFDTQCGDMHWVPVLSSFPSSPSFFFLFNFFFPF